MGDNSDGNVVGLREYFNDWVLRKFMNENLPGAFAPLLNPITYLGLGTSVGDDNAGSVFYELLDRRGVVAIWALRYVYARVRSQVVVSYDPDTGHTCYAWQEDVIQVIPYNLYEYYSFCETEFLTTADMGTDLCFLTVGHAMPVGEVQSGSVEHVVAMGVCDSYDTDAVWKFLLDDFMPEQTLWRNDSVPHVSGSYPTKGVRTL